MCRGMKISLREMDEGIKKDIRSVMEDFSKDPGAKDFRKMKTQYVILDLDLSLNNKQQETKKKTRVEKGEIQCVGDWG